MIKYRRANENDKDGIAEILTQSYNIRSVDEGTRVFLSELKRGYNFIIAEENGKILGLISWISHGLPKHGLAELDRIAILADFRKKGIGTALFGVLVKMVKSFYVKNNSALRKLYVLTHFSNKKAQNFYEKIGFESEVVLKDHFYKGEDEIVYSIFF